MANLLKKLGTIFVTLTDEVYSLAPNKIESILVVNTGSKKHIASLLNFVSQRFRKARITILTPSFSKKYLRTKFHPFKIITFEPESPGFKILTRLYQERRRKHDLLILMTTDVSLALIALLTMPGYKTLYNCWDEWFLVRFKTISEILIGKNPYQVLLWLMKRSLTPLKCLFVYSYLFISVTLILTKAVYYRASKKGI
ncbi:hypothetical protein KAT51_02220 [bacterium]|nr:hypothetical protein [bacterium]